jgi:bacterioferritin
MPTLNDTLNEILAAEREAVDQYRLQRMLADVMGYTRLAEKFGDEQREESGHADRIVARIDFLKGSPAPAGEPVAAVLPGVAVDVTGIAKVGSTPEEMLANNRAAELRAVQLYNAGIEVCLGLKDHGTRLVLERNLRDEEEHLLWVEQQLSLIEAMGKDNWRASMVALTPSGPAMQ